MSAAAAKTIHERLVAILAEMPAIGKNQRNEQQGFMFRGHDDVLNALNPLLAKHQVVSLPDVVERVTAQRTTSKGSVMFEVNLHVRFRFYGAAGDFVEASTWGEGTDMGDKATNKAMTMAFKNVLNQVFAISNAETDDPDRHTPEESAKPASPEAAGTGATAGDAATPEAKKLSKRLLEVCDELGVDDKTREAVEAHWNDEDWLRSSLATAEANLEKFKADAESPFQAPVLTK